MKLAWATDVHLDFTDVEIFLSHIRNNAPDALVITGDISTGTQILKHLERLTDLGIPPVYFVLGNHDFYKSAGIHKHRAVVDHYSRVINGAGIQQLVYLTTSEAVVLAPGTVLVGHDGWYDAKFGTPLDGRVKLNDWYLIPDFHRALISKSVFRDPESGLVGDVDYYTLVEICDTLGKNAAREAEINLLSAIKLEKPHTIYFATHVPPFREASTYKGKPSDNDWAPWFTSKHMGDMLVRVAQDHPDIEFKVLCGHSHGESYMEQEPNLKVWTGGAKYGAPEIGKVWEIK